MPKSYPEKKFGEGRAALFGTAQAGAPMMMHTDTGGHASTAFISSLRKTDGVRYLAGSHPSGGLYDGTVSIAGGGRATKLPCGAPLPHSAFRSSFAKRRAAPTPLGYLNRAPPSYEEQLSKVDHGVTYERSGDLSGGIPRARERAVGHIVERDGMFVRTVVTYGPSQSQSESVVSGDLSVAETLPSMSLPRPSPPMTASPRESEHEYVVPIEKAKEELAALDAEIDLAALRERAMVLGPVSRPRLSRSSSRSRPPSSSSSVASSGSQKRTAPSPLEAHRARAAALREAHRAEMLAHQAATIAGTVVITREKDGSPKAISITEEDAASYLASATSASTSTPKPPSPFPSTTSHYRYPDPTPSPAPSATPHSPTTTTTTTTSAGDFLAAVKGVIPPLSVTIEATPKPQQRPSHPMAVRFPFEPSHPSTETSYAHSAKHHGDHTARRSYSTTEVPIDGRTEHLAPPTLHHSSPRRAPPVGVGERSKVGQWTRWVGSTSVASSVDDDGDSMTSAPPLASPAQHSKPRRPVMQG